MSDSTDLTVFCSIIALVFISHVLLVSFASRRIAIRIVKDDDGHLDVLVKVASIAAIVVAAHQYYYKVYPVWSKEKELEVVTEGLRHADEELTAAKSEVQSLQTVVADLKLQESELSSQVDDAQERIVRLNSQHEAERRTMRDRMKVIEKEAELQRQEMATLRNETSTERQKLLMATVKAHLSKFSRDIAQIQLDSIRYDRGEEELDLRNDILLYVKDQREGNDDTLELAALDVLEHHAQTEVKEGVKEYWEIVGLPITVEYNSFAIEQVRELMGGT